MQLGCPPGVRPVENAISPVESLFVEVPEIGERTCLEKTLTNETYRSERAKERYPDARPRIISDNGPQYIAKDFKAFIRISGMTHVRTAPYYPQSNGKIERWHKTIKSDALRPASPTSHEEARRLMERFVEYYNGVRLHSAIGYIAPLDFMDGKATQIWSERDRKLEQARKLRRERRANKVPA